MTGYRTIKVSSDRVPSDEEMRRAAQEVLPKGTRVSSVHVLGFDGNRDEDGYPMDSRIYSVGVHYTTLKLVKNTP